MITDVKFVQGFIRMCNDGWEPGGMRETAATCLTA